MIGMGLKDAETAMTADWAIKGWMAYVHVVTRHLPETVPVDQRLAEALVGDELPLWLEDGIRTRLVAARGEALVARVTARARDAELVDTDLPHSGA